MLCSSFGRCCDASGDARPTCWTKRSILCLYYCLGPFCCPRRATASPSLAEITTPLRFITLLLSPCGGRDLICIQNLNVPFLLVVSSGSSKKNRLLSCRSHSGNWKCIPAAINQDTACWIKYGDTEYPPSQNHSACTLSTIILMRGGAATKTERSYCLHIFLGMILNSIFGRSPLFMMMVKWLKERKVNCYVTFFHAYELFCNFFCGCDAKW